jgi:hypothetical protein
MLSTILSFPPLPIQSRGPRLQTDTWTGTGWTKDHILQLFDTLFAWEHLPICLLRKDLFIRDYKSGSTKFCSPALVHATLALATRLISEDDSVGILPAGWLESATLFDIAKIAVENNASNDSIADTQALGMLSLYQIRCGRETEAWEYAEGLAHNIAKLGKATRNVQEEEDTLKAIETAHNGAVMLLRYAMLC